MIADLVEGAKKKSANGSLQSILSQIDNVPSGYKVGDFSKQLAHFVVENRIYLSKTLSPLSTVALIIGSLTFNWQTIEQQS